MNEILLVAQRYKIIKKIASGGMADIYMGQDQKLNRKVAIKILSSNYAQDRSFVARFKREAQILAKLSDENIVQIYDWGQYNGSYFICMEYIEGSSLKEIIERKGLIAPRAAARYAIKICEALEAAHKNNLIHRDIKPQNILITADNQVKVTDFGIAKHSLDDATKTLNIIGTANYLSPEQAMGKTIDHRTDIYSLGIVLYEMLTADLPFRGESTIEVSLKHINEAPARPSLMVPGIPPVLEKIVMHCLQKDSSFRYSTVSRLKEDLKSFLNNKKPSIEKPARIKTAKKYFFTKNFLGPLNLISMLSMALAVIFMALTMVFWLNQPNEESVEILNIPTLVGKDYDSVEPLLYAMGIDVTTSHRYDDHMPENAILLQSPEPGSQLEMPASMQLIISEGPSSVSKAIPNLIGLTLKEAEVALNNDGFLLGETEERYSDLLEPDRVLSQDPPYGQLKEENERVALVISKGAQIVTIPNVNGDSYHDAVSNLRSLGLEVEANMVTDYTLPTGTVIGTRPSPGSEVEIGTEVRILVSINQEMVTVPNLEYLELQAAIANLEAIALNYEIREIATGEQQHGLVLSQFPLAGKMVFPNSTVIIFVEA